MNLFLKTLVGIVLILNSLPVHAGPPPVVGPLRKPKLARLDPALTPSEIFFKSKPKAKQPTRVIREVSENGEISTPFKPYP